MFIFIVFVILVLACYFMYVYLTNQIISQRKQIVLLVNHNNELKNKLNKLTSSADIPKPEDIETEETEEPEEI